MKQKIIDIDGFRREISLDYDTLKDLYLVFADEIKREKEAINRLVTIGEIGELIKAVHNIKGIASSYRTPIVFENARNLEVMLKHRDFENINNYVLELNKGIDDVYKEIDEYFRKEFSK